MSRDDLPGSVVLASASSRRRRLLARLVPDFRVVEPQVDERGIEAGGPGATALERAGAKAGQVARSSPDSLVIAADTLVSCGGRILGKPGNRDQARRMLRVLGTERHCVVTAVCVVTPDGRRRSEVARADIEMRRFSEEEIDRYVSDPDVLNRAGAYALRHPDPNVLRLDGSPSCVEGLPLEELKGILQSLYPGWQAGTE